VLSTALLQLYTRCQPEKFSQRMLPCLETLFPGSVISIDEIFHHSGEAVHHADNRDFQGSYPGVVKGFRLYSHQHPSVRYYIEGGTEPIIFLSDLIGLRELRSLEFYQHVFKPFGICDQITLVLPSTGHSAYGASINLTAKVTPVQRALVKELYPHLAQAQQNATLGMNSSIFQPRENYYCVQISILDRAEIQNWPSRARELLDHFFDFRAAGAWQPPPDLLAWMKERRKVFDRGERDWRRLEPLVVTGKQGSLHINLTNSRGVDAEILLLSGRINRPREKTVEGEMTKREKEVVSWVTEGKSNAEIAGILSISVPTVKKHLERIFQKVGVENRMALSASVRHSESRK
jgi:DNA-binding CsgD family transcriptional regulator